MHFLVGALALLAAGCQLLLPFGVQQDARGAPDRPQADRAWPSEPVRADAALERGRGDRPRAGTERGSTDLRPAGTDRGPVPDLRADMRFPDQFKPAPDLAAPSPCAPTAQNIWQHSGAVVCRGPGLVSQGAAVQLCNGAAGWKLCPASLYQKLVGIIPFTPDAVPAAWLAACFLDQGPPLVPPSSTVCTCTNVSSSQVFQYDCGGQLLGNVTALCLGAYSVNQCQMFGTTDQQAQGLWQAADPTTPLDAAVCCQ